MSSDPNKKSARSFQCRDVLWETFEQMARELECSVDYLINESMKQYARQRSYGQSQRPPPMRDTHPPPQPQNSPYPNNNYAAAPPPSRTNMQPLPPPPARGTMPMSRGQNLAPPAARSGPLPAPPPRSGPLPPPPTSRSVPPAPRSAPPPLPRSATPLPAEPSNGFPAAPPHTGTLHIMYQGDKLPITKDRFVIGRGKQSSDLTLKDPNVSRQHAMIEFQNGVYFMVDMGSTNGVEFNGQRIARKQISEGDVFKICDHDLMFTYR